MAYAVDEIDGTLPVLRYPQRAADSGAGLGEIIDTLRRRWRIVAFTTLVALSSAALFVLISPTFYTASTQLLIDPRDRRILGTEVMATSAGSDPTLVESQLRIITSDAVLGRVVAALKLDADPDFAGSAARRESAAVRRTRAIATLRRRVTVSRAERTYVIDVGASAHKPDAARAITDAIANGYLADQAEANQTATRRATDALTSRLSQLRANLREAEDRAQAYRTIHGIVLAQGTLISEQELGDLSRRLVQARVRAEEAQARYDEVHARAGSGGVNEVLGSGVITGLRAQLADITRREAELANTLGDRHPALIEVRAQLANTRRLIGQETSRISQSAASELTIARANEETISHEFAALTGRSQTDNGSLIELRDLERDVDAARKLYEAFLNRAKQTAEQEQIATPGARILAPAAEPLNASYPPALLVLLIALVCGAGLGSTAALVSEQFNDTVRSPEELRASTRVEVFSALSETRHWRFGGGLPRSAISVRALRNTLRNSGERSVLVVSAKDGAGAAATALDLAMAAAISGERVLIVDVDLHGRALSRLTCPASKRGVLEVVQNKVALRDAAHVDAKSGLSLLPASSCSGAVKQVTREQVAALLEAASADFDFVVLSGAPLLDDPDIAAAGGAVDNVVLVVQAAVTRRDEVSTAMRLLRPLRRKIKGAVLTAGPLAEAARG